MIDPGTLTDAVTEVVPVATVIGIIFFLIRFALGQADKRADSSDKRNDVCMSALKETNTTNAALTQEIRESRSEQDRRMDSLERTVHQLAYARGVRLEDGSS